MPRVIQGFLFRCDDDVFPERDNTVCRIVARVGEEGELLSDGPAFWVMFGDDTEHRYFAYGRQLSPWFPTD